MAEDDISEALMAFHERCTETEKKLIDVLTQFNEGMVSNQQGLTNIYAKFLEIEKRQKVIEELLKSDHIEEIVKLIPKEDDILKMINAIANTSVVKLKKSFLDLKEELEELVDRFTF